ncbi:MAG: site-2 protease family protein [Puniceicoccales bacterium]|jgi:Zn-dependent protease|nr:site-2 protease family protein [Puniceicoccales bacterium]
MDFHDLQGIFTYYLWFLLALTIHEWGHAWSACKLGDNTPILEGRLTLNPLAHINLFGTVIIPLLMIIFIPGFMVVGWGNPVAINTNHFKHPRLGEIISFLMGPLCNLVLGLLVLLLALAIKKYSTSLCNLCIIGSSVSVSLGLFNLIPIPPLDGFHILKVFTGMKEETFIELSRIGSLLLLVIINSTFFAYYFSIANHWVLGWFWKLGKILFR